MWGVPSLWLGMDMTHSSPCGVASLCRRRGARSPVFAADSLGTPSHLHPTPGSALPAFTSWGEGWGGAVMSHRPTRMQALLGGKPLCTGVPQTEMNHLLAPLGDC